MAITRSQASGKTPCAKAKAATAAKSKAAAKTKKSASVAKKAKKTAKPTKAAKKTVKPKTATKAQAPPGSPQFAVFKVGDSAADIEYTSKVEWKPLNPGYPEWEAENPGIASHPAYAGLKAEAAAAFKEDLRCRAEEFPDCPNGQKAMIVDHHRVQERVVKANQLMALFVTSQEAGKKWVVPKGPLFPNGLEYSGPVDENGIRTA
ncbi:hypothetical protein LTR53_004578 [Teratosphaeriaceae sp. CCFEE 6253]|nr:hypothetical protein LTR53_004578 [Teratosphaeriaceae sp. CCFEE 6253]